MEWFEIEKASWKATFPRFILSLLTQNDNVQIEHRIRAEGIAFRAQSILTTRLS